MLVSNAVKFSKTNSMLSRLRSTGQSFRSESESLIGASGESPVDHEDSAGGDLMAVKALLLSSPLNALLIAVPLSAISYYWQWGAVTTFLLSFTSLIPLALILGDVTEDLAVRFGDVIGGLINATFGNVVELLVGIAALKNNLFTIVSSSLMGSILSNLLLVLGGCFFFGGLYYPTQSFNALQNRACSSLLFLSSLGIVIPTASMKLLDSTATIPAGWTPEELSLFISRGTALILLLCYVCSLVFQLKTHKDIFGTDNEEEQAALSLPCACILLTIITIIVAFSSEFLTDTIEEASHATGISNAFIGMIILPIAGNACEHITAIVVAMKNKMDLSLGVAVGSSLQISMFAIPFMVVVAWIWGKPFSLMFDPFSVLALTLSVIHANFIMSDSTSHWLMGVELLAFYAIIAIVFYVR